MLSGSVAIGGLPPLREQEVIRIANTFAMKEGVCLSCFQSKVIRYHKAKAGNYWSDYYDPIPNRNGLIAVDSDFSVRVNEASGIASDDPLR